MVDVAPAASSSNLVPILVVNSTRDVLNQATNVLGVETVLTVVKAEDVKVVS